ncbi:MAG: hypothetical protein HPY65_08080 [Syntrophaceae bacterium]|nr:hypothetical protein [Syntrophaceae bacterium]
MDWRKEKHTYLAVVVLCSLGLLLLAFGEAFAEPSTAQVKKMWEGQNNVKDRVLSIKRMGGQRTTNQLDGKHYITPVGTCWDYDIVELQKCGCRLFLKASACCRRGSSRECEMRVGNSKMVDCSPYGKPKFGLAGNTEPADCKTQRMQSECWHRKDLLFGAGVVIGPCMGSNEKQDWPPTFTCPKGQAAVQDFLNKKCGPTPEDCGCTIVEECSSEGGLKCYNDWKSNKAAVDCFYNPIYKSGYEQDKCYKAVMAGGSSEGAKEAAAGAADSVKEEASSSGSAAKSKAGSVADTAVDALKRIWK